MARVQLSTQFWAFFYNAHGRPKPGVAPTFSGTVYLAAAGVETVAPAAFLTDIEGLLPGWVEPGEYTLTDPDGDVFTVQAGGGAGGGAVSSVNGQTGVVVLTKTDVGLGSVDNVSDAGKPVSTAQQTALNLKANAADVATDAELAVHTGNVSNPHAVTKAQVGLGSVTNADHAAALVSHEADTTVVHGIADTSALALSANVQPLDADLTSIAALTTTAYGRAFLALADAAAARAAVGSPATVHTHAQADVTSLVTDLGNKQPLDSDLTAIAAVAPANDDVIQRKLGVWTNRTPAQVKTDLALAKGDVGLGSVDNTSDAAKPVSTATQTALDLKQPLDSDLTAIAAVAPTNDDVLQRKTGAWVNRTMAQVKTDLVLVKGDVGLGSVDNTTDAAKPVSTATQTALNLKQDASSVATDSGVTAHLADTIDAHDATAISFVPDGTIAATTVQAAIVEVRDEATAGTPDADAVTKGKLQLTGDLGGTAASPTVPGLAGKQASDADLTSIAGLTPSNDDVVQRKAGAWANRTMAQVKTDLVLVKGDVGLGSVDNTNDAGKPVSTAAQTALDLKAPLASPTLTGVPAAPTATAGTNTTQLASTAFVTTDLAVLLASPRNLVTVQSRVGTATTVRTFYLDFGNISPAVATANAAPPVLIYLDPAQFPTVGGKTAKLVIDAYLATNTVAPGASTVFTLGLYPVTGFGAAGAGLGNVTVGTVVTGSTGATWSAPAATSLTRATSATFDVPTAGAFLIACVLSGATTAASSNEQITATLRQHWA